MTTPAQPATTTAVNLPLKPITVRPGFARAGSSGVRFGGQQMFIDMPRRPEFTRLMSDASAQSISITSPLNDETPLRPVAPKPPVRLFGIKTQYKPLWLFGIGTSGNWLYGTGTLAIARGVWARRPVAPNGKDMPNLPGVFQPLFGSKSASIGVGVASTAGGIFLAVLASTLAYQDSRRLSRRINPGNTSYMRPNIYYGVHLGAIAVSAGAKFMSFGLRDAVHRDLTWVVAFPLWIGQAAFAVTQAQAFSSVEIVCGKMPLRNRTAIGFAARTLIGTYTVLGVMQTIPYFNAYAKELIRLLAQSCTSLAFALPLTTARIQRHYAAGEVPAQYAPSWHAAEVMALYIVGRFLAGMGPDLMQSGILPQGPQPTGKGPSVAMAFGGAAMLSAGTALCVAAIMIYRQDVAVYSRSQANRLTAAIILGLLFVEAYRGIFTTAIATRNPTLIWVAVAPGAIGAGLRLAILPTMFSFAELRRGTIPIKHRYHWTEACRALGNMGFGIWTAMLAVPGTNSYAKEAVAVSAAVLCTLGMALPTTTSKRAMSRYDYPMSPGITPPIGMHDTAQSFPFAQFARSVGGTPGSAV